ncbi:MAG: flagellar basal body P-ring protein FlgI [Betaproteobacteria bacterium]|nr:flagellar basal body P-ring protein FlgI [Betaproteobacteria bacterium]NBS40394.1 flagellar basal body P-ring protein FlgI [Betaproteobacteria bacterium]NCY08257.1 flagellar basal body P-ring protein FlgI [Betaproteobacteria bacterium]NDC03693.1 flagellar basal body P-ring protein FlgI [Betaproteobacteria bacterium]NDC86348.1 flagellar basal body P-ring protein FlgI [Betaproteobacteria bacterium]
MLFDLAVSENKPVFAFVKPRSCWLVSSRLKGAGLLLLGLLFSVSVWSAPLKELGSISGVRTNQLIGFGLVVGLDGSGDQTTQTPFTLQTMRSLLQALGVTVPAEDRIQLRNTAAVMVTASLPAFAKPGQSMDVTVSSVGNAKTLRGGMLLMTPLRGADGQVYAMAQGSVLVPGAGAGGGGASVTVNHQSVGRVPSGATIERPVQQSAEEDILQLDLHRADFGQMQRVVEAIAKRFGPNVAVPLDGRTIQVRMPQDQLNRTRFLSDLLALSVDLVEESPRVIINSRTGSVVMNQGVRLDPVAVAHGNLTVKISRDTQVSQPAPLSQGQTAVTQRTNVDVNIGPGTLGALPKGASLEEVVRALNLLGANAQDLVAILQAMKAAGSLRAELEII